MTSETLELILKIRAIGQAEIDQITRSIRGLDGTVKGHAPTLDGLERQIGSVVRQCSVMGPAFGNAASQAGDFFALLKSGVGVTVAAVAAFGLVGKAAYDLVAAEGAVAEGTINLADRLGIAVGAAEQLQAAAKIVGVNIGTLEGSARLLSAALEDQSGQGEKTAGALRKLGVNTHEVSGQQREMGQVLLDTLGKLAQIKGDSERVLIAQQTLGRSGARELIPLIKSYDELQRVVRALGVGVDEDLTRNLARADDRIGELSIAWSEFKKSVAGKIAPIIIEILPKVGRGGLSIDDLKRMGVVVPKQFQPTSDAESFDRAAAAGIYTQQQVEQEQLSRLKRIADFATQQADVGAGREASERFNKQRASGEDGQKRRLENLKREAQELEAVLRSGSLGGQAFAGKRSELERLEAEARSLEETLRTAQSRQSLIKQLPELLAQSRKAGLVGLERMNVEQLELLRRLGPGFEAQVAAIFLNPRQTELARLIRDSRKPLGDALEESGKEFRERLSFDNRQFQDALKNRIDGDEKAVQTLRETLDVLDSVDRDRLTRRALRDASVGTLTAGPGDELQVAEQRYQRQIQLARELFSITSAAAERQEDTGRRELDMLKARGDLERDLDQARIDRELEVLEVRKRSLHEYRETAGRVFDALTARGNGGLREFFSGQLKILERQIFVNASAGLFQQFGSTLGRVGQSSGLGGLLQGTIFDPKNAAPVDKNTFSLDRVRVSLDKLNGTLRSTGLSASAGTLSGDILRFGSDIGGITGGIHVPGLGELPGIADLFGIGGKATPEAVKGQIQNVISGLGSVFTGGLFAGLRGGDRSIQLPDGTATTASAQGLTSTAGRVSNIAGSLALVAGGTQGVISGIREGGARGTTSAIASGLAVAAAIPGPQQPFIQAGALIAGFVSTLFGDPKKQRAEEIARAIKDARVEETPGRERTIDQFGRDLDHDYRGRLRAFESEPRLDRPTDYAPHNRTIERVIERVIERPSERPAERPVIVNVHQAFQAFDAKSILDRSSEIAESVRIALRDGHDLNETIMRNLGMR